MQNALTVGDGVGPALATANAQDGHAQDAAGGAPSEKGRVLLLEANPFFRDATSECLTENGYKVAIVENTQGAISEIMAGDFALVLYDSLMPGLSCEMFYCSVRRLDPALCGRFVFMSDDRNDEATNEFIKKINGLVLKKPFDVRDLLTSLALAELRGEFHSVFEDVPGQPGFPQDWDSPNYFKAGAPHAAQPATVAKILARSRPSIPQGASKENDPQPRTEATYSIFVLAALMLVPAITAGLLFLYDHAREGMEAATSQRLATEAEWASLTPGLEKALALRSKTAQAEAEMARLSTEQTRPRWAPVLRGIMPPKDAAIRIRGVEARGEAKDLGACEVRVSGTAGGEVPRLTADHYRESAEENLKQTANGRPVNTRFERLDDVPGEPPEEKRAEFVIIVTVGSIQPLGASSKEGH